MAEVTWPMNHLTGRRNWEWKEEQEKAFQKTKELFIKTEIMSFFESEATLIIKTDASDHMIRGVLKKKTKEGEKVIEFYSRKLN